MKNKSCWLGARVKRHASETIKRNAFNEHEIMKVYCTRRVAPTERYKNIYIYIIGIVYTNVIKYGQTKQTDIRRNEEEEEKIERRKVAERALHDKVCPISIL